MGLINFLIYLHDNNYHLDLYSYNKWSTDNEYK